MTPEQIKGLKIAALVVAVVVVAALAWRSWTNMHSAIFAVSSAAVAGTALTLTVSKKAVPDKFDLSKLGGKKLKVTTKSLGVIDTTVAGFVLAGDGSGTITTATGAVPANAAYKAAADDTAQVFA